MSNKNEFTEVTREIVGWEDNKIVRTMRDLTITPGAAVEAYCKGEKSYLSPIVYCFGATGAELYVANVIGLSDALLDENLAAFNQSLNDPSIASYFNTDIIADRFTDYYTFLLGEIGQKLILIPLLLLLTYIFYNRFNKSFKQNSWFALFSMGHATLLSIPLMGLWYFFGSMTGYTTLSILLYLGYWTFGSKQFYNLGWGKAIFLRVLMMLTVMIVLNLMTLFIVLGLMLTSPK
jgi:hypothetical protein